MRALSERTGWEPVFVPGVDFKEHRGGFARAAAPAGIPVCDPERGPDLDARALGLALLGEAIRWSDGLSASESFDARVLGASARRRLFGRPYAASLFEEYAQYESSFEALIRRERPEIVVLGEDTDYLRGRLAARILGGHRIPIVCLAAFYYNVFDSYPLLGRRRAALYLTANRSYADRLRRSGVAGERIAVVGNPAFDALFGEVPAPEAPPMVLYAMQGLPWEREILKDLVAIARDASNAVLAVKPHPELPPPDWLALLRSEPNVRFLSPDADAVALLRRAACVIAQSSAMLYQASVIGRPVIVPHYDALPLGIYLPEGDRTDVVARTQSELGRAIEKVLDGRGRALERAQVAPFHPRATERVVECLERFRERHFSC
jgi:hypothetical protein